MVNSKSKSLVRQALIVFLFVFLVWGFYRSSFLLPEWLEEFVLKPLVFLLPVFFFERNLISLGISSKNLFKSIYLGLGLGMVFAFLGLMTNYAKYGGFSLATFDLNSISLLWLMLVSLVTAVSEEILFRGFIFNQLFKAWENEMTAGTASALLFALIHLPIALFVWDYNFSMVLIHGFLSFLLGYGNAFLMARTKTVVAPIINHTLWGLAVFLFR